MKITRELDLPDEGLTLVKHDTYVAAWPIELETELPEVNYVSYTQRIWKRVAHVLVPDCQPGDVLQCKFTFEVTNEQNHALELSGGLVLTPASTGTAGVEDMPSVSSTYQPTNGLMVSRMGGYNVTPQIAPGGSVWHGMHHGEIYRNVDFIVPEGVSGDRYVAAMFYCGGSSYTVSGGKLVIEPYCGDMSVTRIRKS